MALFLSAAALLLTLIISAAATGFCQQQVLALYTDSTLIPFLSRMLYAYSKTAHCMPLLLFLPALQDAVKKNLRKRQLDHAVALLAFSLIAALMSLVINALPFIKLAQRFQQIVAF